MIASLLVAAIAALVLAGASWRLGKGLRHPRATNPQLDPRYTWLIIPAGALLAGLLAQVHSGNPAMAVIVAYGVVGVVVAWIDWDHHLILDAMMIPLTLSLVAYAGIWAWIARDWKILAVVVTGAVIYAGLGFFEALFGSKGLGDVTLMGASGALLALMGWAPLVWGIIAGYVLVALFVAISLIRGGRNTMMAIGPYIVAGTLLGTLAAN